MTGRLIRDGSAWPETPYLRASFRLRDGSSFFFQAEDGIRDLTVTGVQTCALPILGRAGRGDEGRPRSEKRRPERERDRERQYGAAKHERSADGQDGQPPGGHAEPRDRKSVV